MVRLLVAMTFENLQKLIQNYFENIVNLEYVTIKDEKNFQIKGYSN